jgi:hypothetical protein
VEDREVRGIGRVTRGRHPERSGGSPNAATSHFEILRRLRD